MQDERLLSAFAELIATPRRVMLELAANLLRLKAEQHAATYRAQLTAERQEAEFKHYQKEYELCQRTTRW